MALKSRNIPFIYHPPLSNGKEIVYIDDDIIMVNKQSGLLSVPGKGEKLSDCLESRIKKSFPEAKIVHRLDMSTSGIMIFARNKESLRILGMQFEKRQTAKTYIALIWGVLKEKSGSISKPLRCDWPNRPKQIIDFEQGKEAITHWELIAHEGAYSRIKLSPITGRSHQLRVHMQSLGHPILGDEFYANDEAYEASDRLMLHALNISFFHPKGGKRVSFSVPCPF